jgi:DNA-binding GntR family transcriptional regulator
MAAPRALEVLRRELAGSSGLAAEFPRESDSSFQQLLRAIISLEYEPGEMLSERELMERTGSSRAALRQAVARLSDLGLITPLARKGLMVAPLDVLDVSVVYDARVTIERGVARLAAQRATSEQVTGLRALSEAELGEAAPEFVERDLALHLALAAAARNRYLEDALTRILPLSARLWHRLYRELGPDRRFMFQHTEIIQAVAERDLDAAEAALVAHLGSAREILASAFLPRGEEDVP